MEKEKKDRSIDYKTAGAGGLGGAGLVGLLMYFQTQGIDMISKNIDANNKVMHERVISNAGKIENNKEQIKELKINYTNLSKQIREESAETRKQNREEIKQLSEIIRIGSADRFTKTEYRSFSGAVEIRFQRIEDEIKAIREEFRK